MRKLIMTMTTAGMLGVGSISGAVAAPVPGYEALYTTLIASCTVPAGTLAACEAAINAYSSALVPAVELTVANQSFTEARAEVFAANADSDLRAPIDALFETLLPDSGAISNASPTIPG